MNSGHCTRTAAKLPLKHNKFVDANNITILIPNEVNIFNGDKIIFTSVYEPILQWWQDTKCGLWQILLSPLQLPTEAGAEMEHTKAPKPTNNELINNENELQGTKQNIQYYHGRVPIKNNMVQSNKCRVLCHVVHADIKGHDQILHQIR